MKLKLYNEAKNVKFYIIKGFVNKVKEINFFLK